MPTFNHACLIDDEAEALRHLKSTECPMWFKMCSCAGLLRGTGHIQLFPQVTRPVEGPGEAQELSVGSWYVCRCLALPMCTAMQDNAFLEEGFACGLWHSSWGSTILTPSLGTALGVPWLKGKRKGQNVVRVAQELVKSIWVAPEMMADFNFKLTGYQVNRTSEARGRLFSVNNLRHLHSPTGCNITDLAADLASDPC